MLPKREKLELKMPRVKKNPYAISRSNSIKKWPRKKVSKRLSGYVDRGVRYNRLQALRCVS